MKKFPLNLKQYFVLSMVFMVSGLLVSGCSSMGDNSPLAGDPQPVTIKLDAKGCPVGVEPAVLRISLSKDQGALWAAESPEGEAVDFSVFFNPFVNSNQGLRSKGGRLHSPKQGQEVPLNVKYKYTIVSKACKDAPLDPEIIVIR